MTPDSEPGPPRVQSLDHSPLMSHLGIRSITLSNDRSEMTLTIGEIHLRSHGLLHGGVTATLLDVAMGLLANDRLAAADPPTTVVTSQMNVHFVRAAMLGETITATGRITHPGRRAVVCEATIVNAAGDLIALATGTYMTIPKP